MKTEITAESAYITLLANDPLHWVGTIYSNVAVGLNDVIIHCGYSFKVESSKEMFDKLCDNHQVYDLELSKNSVKDGNIKCDVVWVYRRRN